MVIAFVIPGLTTFASNRAVAPVLGSGVRRHAPISSTLGSSFLFHKNILLLSQGSLALKVDVCDFTAVPALTAFYSNPLSGIVDLVAVLRPQGPPSVPMEEQSFD